MSQLSPHSYVVLSFDRWFIPYFLSLNYCKIWIANKMIKPSSLGISIIIAVLCHSNNLTVMRTFLSAQTSLLPASTPNLSSSPTPLSVSSNGSGTTPIAASTTPQSQISLSTLLNTSIPMNQTTPSQIIQNVETTTVAAIVNSQATTAIVPTDTMWYPVS